MQKNIKWANKELPGLTHENLLEITIADMARSENGKQTISQNSSFESRQKGGMTNVETGHIKQLGETYGPIIATTINKDQGKKNAKSGHMKSIQPLGASIGGKKGGAVLRDSGKLLEHSKLGNEVNQQKYGERIIGENLITGECWEYISKHEAERDTGVPTCTIRKILKGDQPKTKTGWTFYEK